MSIEFKYMVGQSNRPGGGPGNGGPGNGGFGPGWWN